MLRKLADWTMGWARSRHATVALGTVSFVESSVFPIPADVLFVPMCAAHPERAMRLALVASVTSVLGGIFGWLLGYFAFTSLALPVLELYGKDAAFEALRADVSGEPSIILLLLVTSGLAHLPPMKVVTILSGVVGFSLPLFILSAVIARSARFYGLAWLVQRYGTRVIAFLERRMALVAGAVIALAVGAWLVLRMT